MNKIPALTALLLAACVTINIYFPAAAAEKVADEIIKDIQDNRPQAIPPKSDSSEQQIVLLQWLGAAISYLIAPAQAADADLAIDSAEIRQLRASLETRFASLQPLYAAGTIGIQKDGLLAVRDFASVSLKNRNQITKLVSAENADRQKLYKAIANANGHPEWAEQIQATFAERWISNAQAGWWYQSSGGWKQK
jgi:uncharacterized protein YdbL (DUF1318 family)